MPVLKQPYLDYLPPLTTAEQEALAASIALEGVREPITVDEDCNILDGHHRYAIAPDAPIRTVSGLTEGEKQAYVIASNMQRRNLSPDQKSALRTKQQAIARTLREEGATQAAIAARIGVDQATVSRWLEDTTNMQTHNGCTPCSDSGFDVRVKVPKAAKTAILERVQAGEPQTQIAADFGVTQQAVAKIAKSEAKRKAREKEIEDQRQAILSTKSLGAQGPFDVIIMDPPWNYGRKYDPEGSRVANPYPEMTQQELLELSPPFADDAFLFLWTTHQFLFDAKALMDSWDIAYKATIVWDKQKIGMGSWFRMQCEFCLFGIKGEPPWNNTTHRDFITEARREHSRKPETFYSMIQELFPDYRIGEYFARQERDGIVTIGNDTGKFHP